MKIRQWILASAAVFGLMGTVEAQNASTVTVGEKGKIYVLTGALGVRGGYLSADGMFVGGTAGSDWSTNVGYVYDIARDTLKITTSADVVKSWTVYAGNNTINRDGVLINIESLYPDTSNHEYSHAGVWAASANLDTIVTMAYEVATTPGGRQVVINLPYLVDGKTGKIIHHVGAHWPLTDDALGFGARVNGSNNDATILVGHSSKPNGAQWAPVFWDLKNDTSFFVGTDENSYGDLNCTNNDGTLIGGQTRGNAVIIHYDRQNMTYDFEILPVTPGKSGGMVQSISENGLVLYVQSTGNDIGSREAYIYNMNDKSVVSLQEYARELYGLNLPVSTFTGFTMSDDGRKITGWTFAGGADAPYLIVFDEKQIFAKPRRLNAIQPFGEMKVMLSWAEPLHGQYTLKGYNVYCDSVKINADLIDNNTTTFEHVAGLEQGVHSYTVQAVYEEGESNYCAAANVLVIAADGCLPVQTIGNHVTYNRQTEIYWGLPSANMSQPTEADNISAAAIYAQSTGNAILSLTTGGEAFGREVSHNAKTYQNEALDLVEYKDFGSYSWASALVINDRLYASQYDNGIISVFDMNSMSVIETHTLQVPYIGNMTYANNELYLATGQAEIVVVDLTTMTQSNAIPTNGKIRHLCYIPTLDGGKGGFAYGDWTTLQYCNRFGKELTTDIPNIDIKDLIISGTVYRDGRLYIYSQTGSPQQAELYTVDVATGKYLAKKNIGDIQRLNELEPYYGFVAGGLGLSELRDGTIVLGATMQFSATTSKLALLEVEAAPDLLGYNLYRSKNGGSFEQVNPEGEYIKGLSYTENLMEPGTYTYKVEAVSEGNCTSMLDNVNTKLTIDTIGECIAPASLTATEHAKAVRLDWEYEAASSGPTLVGFNIYRNDELLEEHLVDLKYTDFNREKGDYKYRVEAFYNNSCTASKETSVKVTYEGQMMPPAHLKLSPTATAGNEENYDVNATWELPYYEEPLALGYCNMPYNGTGLQDKVPVYTLIGWDRNRLEAYKDLYVVGIEYFIGEGILTIDGLVYMNDTLAYQCENNQRIKENNWNTLMFDRYFSMDQPMELLVGYKVTYSDETKPVAVFDYGPADAGYGDLFSGDGVEWGMLSSTGINANWCINALVVDKRDLEDATKIQAYAQTGTQPMVKVMSLHGMKLSEPKAVRAAKASSESVKLKGFNIYRDNEKLNAELLKGFSYQDLAVAKGEYDYMVSAVYNDGEEIKGESIYLDLVSVSNLPETLAETVSVFPNPAHAYFRVNGEYAQLEILNMSGKLMKRYTDGRSEIEVTDLTSGLYLLRFTLADGTQRFLKITVR